MHPCTPWSDCRPRAWLGLRLPQSEWVYGTLNSSIVTATFLHGSPTGLRFNGPELGAWYCSLELETAISEVVHHRRREAIMSGMRETRAHQYRTYSALLEGAYEDIRGLQSMRTDLYALASYSASQAFGENIRRTGDGILYDSVRYSAGPT